MPKCTVNGQEVEFEQGMSVLQACELAGEEVPRFCYHERLEIAGNCRMCLVQIEGGPPKPAASCAMPAGDGMVVHTNTPMVKKAREGVMEFLLINHPLDCPICDQGGECDLQDQAMTYGCGNSRFDEHKRSVKDKDFGPLIKTHMTRCIHCTRCVRFMAEVAGVETLGATGRGEDMEVGTFIEQGLDSELSGNIIDLCPVGALTSKPYAYKARPWELRKIESIDVMDAVGSNIRVDAKGKEVMRILPRLHEDINEEWISDKTRFACDGLKRQRLDRPYVRKNGKLVEASWDEALTLVAEKLSTTKPAELGAIAGDMVDAETMLVLKELMDKLGSPHMDCRADGANFDASNPSSYLFNTSIAGIEDADALLLVGANPRHEAAMVNARIRKWWFKRRKPIAMVGQEADLTYPYMHLGDSADVLEAIASGKHEFSKVLKNAKNPMIIVGSHVFTRNDASAIEAILADMVKKFDVVSDDWNGYNVLHRAASRVGGLMLGFVPQAKGKDAVSMVTAAKKGVMKTLYVLGADEIDLSGLKDCFVIYQGHHGDAGASHADVILPGAAYTEKSGTYVNLEGRVQRTERAVFPVGSAREDWQIVNDVAVAAVQQSFYDNLRQVRDSLVQANEKFNNVDELPKVKYEAAGSEGKLLKAKLVDSVANYYMTDPISRASQTMAACTEAFVQPKTAKKVA